MKSSKLYPLKGIVEIDETVVGQQEEDVVGRANKKKKLVIVGIEKQGKGVSRMYVKVVPGASEESFKPFFIDYIDKRRKLGQMDGQRIKLFWKIIPTSNRRKVARKVKISKICIG